jgi:hypothetical protein
MEVPLIYTVSCTLEKKYITERLASPGEQPCGLLGYLSNDANSEQIVCILLSNFLDADWLLVCGVACVLMVTGMSQGTEVPVCLLCVVLMMGLNNIIRPPRRGR